jgi:hypothetical protein
VTRLPDDVTTDLLRAARSVRVDRGQVWVDGLYVGRSGPAIRGILADALYLRWFSQAAGRLRGSPRPDFGLVARLRAAHAASCRFESGWTAAVDRFGRAVAIRAGQARRLQPFGYANLSRPGAPIRRGDRLAVSARRDAFDRTGGWWLTEGSVGVPRAAPLVRVYWNGGADVAAELMGRLTEALEDGGHAYIVKCPTAAPLFDRVDPIVLYVDHGTWSRAKSDLRAVHASVEPSLRPGTPPLTRRLGRGVAVAEDPGGGRSFGQSRTAAVAAGLAALLPRRLADDAAVVETLAAALAAHGISPTRPHVGAASAQAGDEVWSWDQTRA